MSERVALCLNSSFLGFFAHAGFLHALTTLGIRPVAVSGASAGALVAGLYAAGVSPEEMQRLFVSPELRGVFREPGVLWRGLATMLNLPGHTGAIRGDRALSLLKQHLGDRRIEDCPIAKLAISTTNLAEGRAELVARGPLAEYILASGTFPGFFAARAVEQGRYWDGGLANPLPFDHWLDEPEIDTILLHVVSNPEEGAALRRGRSQRISGAMNVAHQAICGELLRLKTELARRAGKRLVFLSTVAPRPSLWHPADVGANCVEIGAATVAKHRAELAELVP